MISIRFPRLAAAVSVASLACLSLPAAAADVYKCTNATGKVEFQDRPCEGKAMAQKLDVQANSVAPVDATEMSKKLDVSNDDLRVAKVAARECNDVVMRFDAVRGVDRNKPWRKTGGTNPLIWTDLFGRRTQCRDYLICLSRRLLLLLNQVCAVCVAPSKPDELLGIATRHSRGR